MKGLQFLELLTSDAEKALIASRKSKVMESELGGKVAIGGGSQDQLAKALEENRTKEQTSKLTLNSTRAYGGAQGREIYFWSYFAPLFRI